jgi:hypothetical protein
MREAYFNLPRDDEHIAIIGRNGSGKTQFAAWMLAERSWPQRPWIILNFKRDPLLDAIPRARSMALDEKLPRQSGIYNIRQTMTAKEDSALLDIFFQRVWDRGRIGLFIDEGYIASGLKWFRACLTQGRSRHVPMMILSQRPVWMDRFVWSEASYYVAFALNLKDDRETAGNMIPGYRDIRLPPFHALWHAVKRDQTLGLTPVPDSADILTRYRARAPFSLRAI